MTTTTILIALFAFFAGFSGKKFIEQMSAERKGQRDEQRRIRQEEDEATRYFLFRWAFGESDLKNAPPVAPPINREEVIGRLRDRDAAIKLLEAIPVSHQRAEQEYERFINWLDCTDGKREMRDVLPMYLLGIWADPSHPQRGKNILELMRNDFHLSKREAEIAIDRYSNLLP